MPQTTMPNLAGFIGSENYYRHFLLKNFLYTDGMKFLADEVGAHWFIDLVASHLVHSETLRKESFQLWAIELNDNGGGLVTVRSDSGRPPIVTQEIDYTDFPENFECYCCSNELGGHTLFLKGEY